MQKWEYVMVEGKFTEYSRWNFNFNEKNFSGYNSRIELLNYMGELGWEMTGIEWGERGGFWLYIYFKRPKS